MRVNFIYSLFAAFTWTNVLALNFYFIKIFTLNFIYYFEPKLRPCVWLKLLVFRKSRKSKIFDNQKSTGLSWYKILQNYTENFKFCRKSRNYTGKYRNFWHLTVYVKNRRLFSRLSTKVGTIRYIPFIMWPKLEQICSKNGQKSRKLYQNIRLLTKNDPL